MLEGVIIQMEERFNQNRNELAKLVDIDMGKNVKTPSCFKKSQVMDSVVKLPNKEVLDAAKSPVRPSSTLFRNNLADTINTNTVTRSKVIDMTKLTPNCPASVVNISGNKSSLGFIDEIQKLSAKYQKPVCSLENFSALSPLVEQEETTQPKNSLNNENFREFIKVLADRIKDRYEDNLSAKVFGQ